MYVFGEMDDVYAQLPPLFLGSPIDVVVQSPGIERRFSVRPLPVRDEASRVVPDLMASLFTVPLRLMKAVAAALTLLPEAESEDELPQPAPNTSSATIDRFHSLFRISQSLHLLLFSNRRSGRPRTMVSTTGSKTNAFRKTRSEGPSFSHEMPAVRRAGRGIREIPFQ